MSILYVFLMAGLLMILTLFCLVIPYVIYCGAQAQPVRGAEPPGHADHSTQHSADVHFISPSCPALWIITVMFSCSPRCMLASTSTACLPYRASWTSRQCGYPPLTATNHSSLKVRWACSSLDRNSSSNWFVLKLKWRTPGKLKELKLNTFV